MPEELKGLYSLLSAICTDEGTYATRKVERTELPNGLIVSTAFTSDAGYETAILDVNGTYPVERYGQDRDSAVLGHGRWVTFVLSGQVRITKLGDPCGLLSPTRIVLKDH